jgi:hypothetical protein
MLGQTDPLFEVHLLNETGIEKSRTIAEAYNSLLNEIRPLVPEGREWSIIKAKLEEACFYTKKGMANLPANQGRVNAAGSAG